MIQFIKTTKGLKDVHQEEFPLFEKTYVPPGLGNKHISRLYADGSLYYLISSGRDENGHESENWNYISAVTENGLAGIQELLHSVCNLKINRNFSGNNMGAIIWKITCNNQVKEYIIAGLPDDDSKIFTDIDSLINFNMRIIPPGK
jgi:hypothetical protein